MILLDTSILIDYYRKRNKQNTRFVSLQTDYSHFLISSISEYEIRVGVVPECQDFWDRFLSTFEIVPLDSRAANTAASVQQFLKRRRMQLGINDLYIAATALCNDVPLATLNIEHFARIPDLLVH
ncbi:MAG: type II toxin-antitoxin system VapC family toxin [Thermoguttaceae bacterium]